MIFFEIWRRLRHASSCLIVVVPTIPHEYLQPTLQFFRSAAHEFNDPERVSSSINPTI